ncbi:MAG: hypothetical protein IKJ39_06390 [Lachnospiraceae bacterium]|nr:hypothetical protein [Lachnospiraceae bacterium]
MKNKKIYIPGALLLLTAIFYFLYRLQLDKYYALLFPESTASLEYWIYTILYSGSFIALSVSCFAYRNILLNKILYFVPLSVLCLLNAYWFILDARYIIDSLDSFLAISAELLLSIVCFLFVLFRLIPKKSIAKFGFIVLIAYCIIYVIVIPKNLSYDSYDNSSIQQTLQLLWLLWHIMEPISLTYFGWLLTKNVFSKKTDSEQSNSINLEKELLILKNYYEAGNLSEAEYTRLKAEIIQRF